MLVMLVALISWFHVVSPWLTSMTDHWQYGEARISELDADVGHGGMSHFLAEYTHGQVLVIELPFGNHQGMQVYGIALDTTYSSPPVITLSVVDVKHDGRLDLQVQIEGDPITYILYNNGTSFQGTPPTS